MTLAPAATAALDGRVPGAFVGLHVEVHAVLGRLALGHGDEEQSDPQMGERRRDDDLGVVVVVDVPAEHLGPERGQRAGVRAVERDVVDLQRHERSLLRADASRQPRCHGPGPALYLR